jgi:ATP-dependent Lon protease
MTQEKMPEDIKSFNIPEILPIMTIDSIVFPKMIFPLEVVDEHSIKLVDEAMASDRLLGIVPSQKYPRDREEKFPALPSADMGACAVILKMARGNDGKTQLLVQGLSRFKITEYLEGKPYLQARVSLLEDEQSKDIETEALMHNLAALFDRVVKMSPFLPPEFSAMAKTISEAGTLADMIASIINTTLEEKHKILTIMDVKERLKEVTLLVNHQVEVLELGNKIQSQVKNDMDKVQRDYYLRQQLKAIKQELGEGEGEEANLEVNEYRDKMATANLPEEAKKEAERELARLSRMHPSSSEYTVASTYLDWLTALPWSLGTEDSLDIKQVRKILDDDHFGLEKAKKRIIEYLAVRKLKPDSKGPILCLVGPPGTGKTSLGHSIGRAMGRKFIRISLGGVHDEAEIRGHRRTYVGALPGRIIQGIRRAGSNNPVFMLDEIDKVGSDFRGDPSSALLEVLDPEQNSTFVDHYLDVPFDLSRVMFVTTANVLDTIPPALRDRLEIIELPGYTQDEKIRIAERYLLPRQIAENGLTEERINITKGAIKLLITGYTREAGVRNLEREIASLCRGVASQIAEEKIQYSQITVKDVHKYLGPLRINNEAAARVAKPGVAMGLAWTPTGGDMLFIEATAMKGKGSLTLTGQLGDIMKESAQAALSFIRTNAATLKIPEDFFEKNDLHIHVPAGAIPKDGPSAGVTMLTALTSLLTGRKVKKDLAMTGEITLRGLVLPVGGIKEKVLAAHRAGVKTILLPQWNKKDLSDIPLKVRKEISFYFLDDMLEVVKLALEK